MGSATNMLLNIHILYIEGKTMNTQDIANSLCKYNESRRRNRDLTFVRKQYNDMLHDLIEEIRIDDCTYKDKYSQNVNQLS